jgi:hypothetical protein
MTKINKLYLLIAWIVSCFLFFEVAAHADERPEAATLTISQPSNPNIRPNAGVAMVIWRNQQIMLLHNRGRRPGAGQVVTSRLFHGYYFQPHKANRLMHRMTASNKSAAAPTVAAYPAGYRSSGSGLRGNTRRTVFEKQYPHNGPSRFSAELGFQLASC